MNGQIIRIISNLYSVKCSDGIHECRARGKFRNMGLTPLVGDYVKIQVPENYILDIDERKNELARPMIANVDMAVIVTSCKHPDYSAFLLDKMLVNVILNDIEPIICFTKYDLLDEEEKKNFNEIIKYYNSIGISSIINTELDKLFEITKDKIVVLTGQTGAGKSTLMNKLDKNLNLATNEISEALGRGKHTTRHVELFKVRETYFADTPGFSALDILNFDKTQIRFAFPEFRNEECKFNDCKHIKEIGCKVKEDVENKKIMESRYESYLNMVG